MSGKLSEGAESIVFRGRWQGQDVAIKKVRIATSADLDRFRRELELLAALHHPAVVPLLGARALPPDYMIVLPLAPGGNVRHALYEQGWRPSWRQVLGLAYAVAAGMDHVHTAGILHRDLKPANLLLLEPPPRDHQQHRQQQQHLQKAGSGLNDGGGPADEAMCEGEGGDAGEAAAAGGWGGLGVLPGGVAPLRVQIADFGIAVRERTDGAAGGGEGAAGPQGQCEQSAHAAAKSGKPSGGFYKRQMVGTLEYMAPELLLRTAPASRASDVYAWAVTVNELATGVVPFSDCTKDNPEVHTVLEMGYGRLELAAAVCAEGLRPLLPRACPPGFAALMRECWRADPAERPSFAQVLRALERLAEEVVQWEEQQQQAASAAGKLNGQHHHHQHRQHQPVVISAVMVDEADAEPAAAATEMDVCEESHNNGAIAITATATAAEPPASPAPSLAAAAQQQQQQQQQVVLPPFVVCPGEGADDAEGALADCSPNGSAMPGGCLAAALRSLAQRVAHAEDGAGGGTGPAAAGGCIFNAGMFEAIGPRDTMEDRCVLLPEVLLPEGQRSGGGGGDPAAAVAAVTLPLVALFDGHRGADAAEFCRVRLAETLWAEAQRCGSPATALRRTFLRLETEYHAQWQQQQHRRGGGGGGDPASYPGTTALAVLLAPGGRLLVANAGDCRAVVCRGRRALAASRDHTGLLEDERRRLAAAGTAMTWQHGGWRVGSSGLQVTRCIGDFDVKSGAAATTAAAGVTALPEITCLQLQSDDHFVVLGTDGLWDVVSAQEAVGLVYDTVKDPTLAAKRLATEALMRGSADNVSVVVVFLSRVGTFEQVYGAAEGEAYEVTGTAYGSRVRLTKDRHVTAAADEVRDTY